MKNSVRIANKVLNREAVPFTMQIEKPVNVIKQHGFHLGTDLKIAERFVIEQLKNGAVSVLLMQGNRKFKMYDYRDLPEYNAN